MPTGQPDPSARSRPFAPDPGGDGAADFLGLDQDFGPQGASWETEPFDGEERILIDSPKVATYDLKPEMSAFLVRDKLVEAIRSDKYDVIIINFANGDMVGHTGVYDAIIKAVETVDRCVHDVVEAVLEKGGACVVTADHGNAEQTVLADGSPMTAHTTNDVPLTVVGAGKIALRKDGALCDIAPTLLELLGLPDPPEMTGASLIRGNAQARGAA